jgi:hypothetical protein
MRQTTVHRRKNRSLPVEELRKNRSHIADRGENSNTNPLCFESVRVFMFKEK